MKEKKKKINLVKVAKDIIIKLEFDDKDTLKDCYDKFFEIMKKHNIKKGTETEHGILGDNYEWTMCATLFEERLKDHIKLQFMFDEVIPKELRY